ncbi:MAG: hypothetical protein ACRDHL_08415, partial [Candidatus Promineifilaceae bacterium]
PLPDLRSLAAAPAEALAYALLIAALFGLYALAYGRARRAARPPRPALVGLAALLFGLPLLFAFPINATDVYGYVLHGRTASVYGRNPYLSAPAENGDPLAPAVGEWADLSSPYGPVWEGLAAAVTRAAGGQLWPSLLLFKGLGLLAHLGGGALLAAAQPAGDPRRRALAALLWLWNPALLLIFVMNGHNDGLMIFWLLLGWWLIGRGRPGLGLGLAVLAPLTKAIALLAPPFLLLAAWRLAPSPAARARALLVGAGLGAALTWLAFAPYGPPWALAGRLASEASQTAGYSPLTLYILQAATLDIHPSFDRLAALAGAGVAALALWLVWRSWRGRPAARGAADLFFGYSLLALTFRLWYTAWPFPWLALDHLAAGEGSSAASPDMTGPRLLAGQSFLLLGQLSGLIYGQLRVELLLGSHLAAHWLGVPLIFGLPLLVGFAAAGRSARSRGPQTER